MKAFNGGVLRRDRNRFMGDVLLFTMKFGLSKSLNADPVWATRSQLDLCRLLLPFGFQSGMHFLSEQEYNALPGEVLNLLAFQK